MKKYKLINNLTKEETICSLVTIDGFDYYVSNTKQPSVDGELYHCSNKGKGIDVGNGVPEQVLTISKYAKNRNLCKNCKLVIATNNPIGVNNTPQITGVEKLAHVYFEKTAKNKNYFADEKFREHYHTALSHIFIGGYNKAKETYHFTVQDMLDFGKYCINNQLCKEENRYYQYWELLQIFKEQQIKTIFYEK